MVTREQLLALCALAVGGICFTAVHLGGDGSAGEAIHVQQSRWQAEQMAALRSEVGALRSEIEAVRAEAKNGDAAMHARISAAETTWSTAALSCVCPEIAPSSARRLLSARGLVQDLWRHRERQQSCCLA